MAIFVSRQSSSAREPHIVRYAGAVVGPVPPGAFLFWKDIVRKPNSFNRQWYVYAILDPRDFGVRYVGKTVNLKRRIYDHSQDKRWNKDKRKWTLELSQAGLSPEYFVIEIVVGIVASNVSEKKWIRYFREEGIHLFNATDGGEGSPGHIKSKSTIEKIRANLIGKNRPAEVGEKISKTKKERGQSPRQVEAFKRLCEQNKGRKRSPEACKKMSERMLGKSWGHHSEENRRQMSERRKGKPKSEATKARMAAAAKLRYLKEGQSMFTPKKRGKAQG